MSDAQAIADKMRDYLLQQADLSGTDAVLLGITPQTATETARTASPEPKSEAPVRQVPPEPVKGRQIPELKPNVSVEQAGAATQLAALDAAWRNCTRCALHATRKNIVQGSGNAEAKLLLLLEMPDAQEDAAGTPGAGEQGKLIDRILNSMHFKRDEVYLTNILKCGGPSAKQSATPLKTCFAYFEKQVEVIRPEFILCLGETPIRMLLKSREPFENLRGKVHNWQGSQVVATLQPSDLGGDRELYLQVFEDMKLLRSVYDKKYNDKPELKSR